MHSARGAANGFEESAGGGERIVKMFLAEIFHGLNHRDNPLSELMPAMNVKGALERVIQLCRNLHRLEPAWIDIYATDIAGQRKGPRLIHWEPAKE